MEHGFKVFNVENSTCSLDSSFGNLSMSPTFVFSIFKARSFH